MGEFQSDYEIRLRTVEALERIADALEFQKTRLRDMPIYTFPLKDCIREASTDDKLEDTSMNL